MDLAVLIRQLQGALAQRHIVRGIIAVAGGSASISEGTGWTVAYDAVGLYTITFDPAFSETPAVTSTPHHGSSDVFATLRAVSPSSAQIAVNDSAGTDTDSNVHFIAVGPK